MPAPYVSRPTMLIEGGIAPNICKLDAPCELMGTGIVFPDENGNPVFHMYGSF